MVRGELAEFILVVVVVFFCIFPLMNDLLLIIILGNGERERFNTEFRRH
jgi:hypothetical protein